MEASGAVFNAGTSVGTRADSVQVNNNASNTLYYTETIYSRNRDKAIYPSPSNYVTPLSRTYKQVLSVELLTAQLPITTYNVEAENKALHTEGENSFRFNEGYIIDNGMFGLFNDRATIREYPNPFAVASGIQEHFCVTSEVQLPHTLTPIKQVCFIASNSNSQSSQYSMSSADIVEITTNDCHNFTTRYCPIIYVMDNSGLHNGKYNVLQITGARTFLAKRLPFQVSFGHIDRSLSLSQTRQESSLSVMTESTMSSLIRTGVKEGGWIYLPRFEGPHQLAEMVSKHQRYAYNYMLKAVIDVSVTFNDKLGQFVFTRSYGQYCFDLLCGSDKRSIFSASMGFAATDYMYGQYSSLNRQQTVLPSDMLMETVRPDIKSESVGESAVVNIERGNYTPDSLADAITTKMQRPIVVKDTNDKLVVQIMGQIETILIPPGMYDPQTLVDCICKEMNDIFSFFAKDKHVKPFEGAYDFRLGSFTFASKNGEIFGLLFGASNITPLLGFESVNYTGNSRYTNTDPIFYPITNRRFTDQIYQTVSQPKDSTFRFIKTGSFQCPIVKVCASEQGLKVFTWTKKTGGAAHGFQSGDIMLIEGPASGNIRSDPPFLGMHVVLRVFDAFSFEISGCLKSSLSSSSSSNMTNTQTVMISSNIDDSIEVIEEVANGTYVASHWIQPFCLFFSGIPNSISAIIGFPNCVSGKTDYVGENQWDLTRRGEVYINIQEFGNQDYLRINKTSDSGPNSKYTFATLGSFVRIPLSSALQGLEFGVLASSSFSRRKQFKFNSSEFSELHISIVDSQGNPIDFHGREHSIDLRILLEQ